MATSLTAGIDYDPEAVLAAEAVARAHCRWHIAPSKTETLTLDGNGSAVFLLPSLYVTAISSVVEDGTALSAADYSWSQNGVMERLGGRWPKKRRSIQVTLTHGYPQCPDDVTEFVRQQASSGGAPPITRAALGGVSASYDGSSLDLLNGYQLERSAIA